MEIRTVKGDEINRAAEVATAAFECEIGSWSEGWRRNEAEDGPDVIWAVYDEGKLVSSCVAVPQNIHFAGRRIRGGYVGGVATLKEHRRRGYAEGLMRAVAHSLREREVLLSYLWPFSFPYYRKFGWEIVSDGVRYTLDREAAAVLEGELEVREILVRELPELCRLHCSYCSLLNGPAVRPEARWIRMGEYPPDENPQPDQPIYRGGSKLWGTYRDGALAGYVVSGGVAEEDKVLQLYELVGTDFAAVRSLLREMAARFDQAGKLGWHMPPGEPGHLSAADPRAFQRLLDPGAMARCADPGRFLLSQPWPEDAAGRLDIQLEDPVFGRERLRIQIEGGGAERLRTGGKQLQLTVQTLVQMVTGYLQPEHAVKLGVVSKSQLEAARLLSSIADGRQSMRMGMDPG